MPRLKKKHKTVDMVKHMEMLGGKKMQSQMIKDANALNTAKGNPDEWSKIVNYGLPEIKDMEGPAEC